MLTVYRASAGSGKTFRLAVEYIKRLVIAPMGYDKILAVTFTNKATEEMKMRILSQLYGIAHDLPASASYKSIILAELQKYNAENHFTDKTVNGEFVRERCRMALDNLLHNYSFFRVETIDRFFQTVLRNLARELDLTPNLRIELGDREIEHEAVDSWIDSLRESDNELLWIMDYIHQTMDEEKSWNIIQSIKKFGEQILRDDYKKYSQTLDMALTDDTYSEYIQKLRVIRKNADMKVKELGQRLWQMIEQHGYDVNSFSYKAKGPGGFIQKLSIGDVKAAEVTLNSYVTKAVNPDDVDADGWCGKKAAAALRDFCRDELKPAFVAAVEEIQTLRRDARSAVVTLNHLSKLRMLNAIQREIVSSNNTNNRFLLSDTQQLLTRMIDGSDSPFIYEKTGSHLHSIMIDEFQDTSSVQWQNFRVLLQDCMSNGHDNLIVGDVKQSIYRWRSGDWRLLNNIQDYFAPDEVRPDTLRVNRRSATRIIEFNNHFFRHAAANVIAEISEHSGPEVVEMVRTAYGDVEQEILAENETSGYVEVVHLQKDSYEEATLDYVSMTISRLIASGKSQRDIAILVRSNRLIPVIAQYCLAAFAESDNPELRAVRFISDDAFQLSSSPAVNILVDVLRYILNPDDDIVRTQLTVAYQQHVIGRRVSHVPISELIERNEMPAGFDSAMRQRLTAMPLYQMCEEICHIFSLHTIAGQSAYLCTFFDMLKDFIQNNIASLRAFIAHWDEVKDNRYIEPDASEGIRMLTIHKSKGLEYDSVIVPFCDWDLFGIRHKPLLWCEPREAPYDMLPVIPLDFDKSMQDTVYEKYYWDEYMQDLVDNLNLLYVAFTRAGENLFVSTLTGQNNNCRGKIFDDIMPEVANELEMSRNLVCSIDITDQMIDDADETENTMIEAWTYGNLIMNANESGDSGVYSDSSNSSESSASGNSDEDNVFLLPSVPKPMRFANSAHQPEFRESRQSQLFAIPEDQRDESMQHTLDNIRKGNVIHLILSDIHTVSDLDSVIRKHEMQGTLELTDMKADNIKHSIMKCLDNPVVADWFSPRWTLYNECTILSYDPDTGASVEHRPDRVMTDGRETIVVDFKLFSLKTDYYDQVREYMDLLRRMGMPNVRGYLWLVMSNKIYTVSD